MYEMDWMPSGEYDETEYALTSSDEDPRGVDTDQGTDDEDDDDPPHQGTNDGLGTPGEDTAKQVPQSASRAW